MNLLNCKEVIYERINAMGKVEEQRLPRGWEIGNWKYDLKGRF